MRKRDSIEFLLDELKPFLPSNYTVDESVKIISILIQAKAMHKEEMVDFGNDLLAQNDCNYIGIPNLAEHYYNETFGGQQ